MSLFWLILGKHEKLTSRVMVVRSLVKRVLVVRPLVVRVLVVRKMKDLKQTKTSQEITPT